jgi:D-glycero-D-manno-heptose 1,7-bisphosphate phosphatase
VQPGFGGIEFCLEFFDNRCRTIGRAIVYDEHVKILGLGKDCFDDAMDVFTLIERRRYNKGVAHWEGINAKANEKGPNCRYLGTMNKCVFLDRDGVLNADDPNYTFLVDRFRILPGVPEALRILKDRHYRLVVVTNQSGIAKGLYTISQMKECHDHLQEVCGHLIDAFYFSPYHLSVTSSLLTKPDTLMFERAIARFGIDVNTSWMVGDRGRDIIPARNLNIRTIQIGDEIEEKDKADYRVESLLEASELILKLE